MMSEPSFPPAIVMTNVRSLYGNRLDVFLSARLVGSITLDENDRSYFAFDSSYMADANRPVLSLSFSKKGGGLVNSIKSTRQQLNPFFSNLLPEGYLRSYIAGKLQISDNREFYLLAALGEDLPGAVYVKPASGFSSDFSADLERDAFRRTDVPRFSLAGLQLKFSAAMEGNGRLTVRSGGTDGDHIVKLPSSRFLRLPECEFASLELARLIGIDTASASLIATDKIAGIPTDLETVTGDSLVLARFDRSAEGRIHIEDFAQVFGNYPADKYDGAAYHDIAGVLWNTQGNVAVEEFVRRLVFNLAIGNADMHLKNWSLIYRDGIHPALAPAYDFVPTIAYHPDVNLALSLGGEKAMAKISLNNFFRFAKRADISSRLVEKIVNETIEIFAEVWRQNQDLYAPEVLKAIKVHLKNTELFKSI